MPNSNDWPQRLRRATTKTETTASDAAEIDEIIVVGVTLACDWETDGDT